MKRHLPNFNRPFMVGMRGSIAVIERKGRKWPHIYPRVTLASYNRLERVLQTAANQNWVHYTAMPRPDFVAGWSYLWQHPDKRTKGET